MELRDITPVILTFDEEANIERTLRQLTWAREVVVLDSGSSDRTVTIAKRFPNVRVVQRPFDTHAQQWSAAVAEARTPWVLTLDADYVVPDAVTQEIASLPEPMRGIDGFESGFVYAVGGSPLAGSLYPPRVVLLRVGHCTFRQDGHTQRVDVDGEVRKLRARIIHDDRKPFGRFVARQRRYMRQEASKLRSTPWRELNAAGRIRKLRVVAPFAVVGHTLFAKRLWRDGFPGFRYAFERFVAEVVLAAEMWRR